MPNSTQSGDLIAISRLKGWEPQKIWDQEKQAYVEDISKWDRERQPFDRNLQNGELVPPAPAHDQSNEASGGPEMNEHLTWAVPSFAQEDKGDMKTSRKLANPNVGGRTG